MAIGHTHQGAPFHELTSWVTSGLGRSISPSSLPGLDWIQSVSKSGGSRATLLGNAQVMLKSESPEDDIFEAESLPWGRRVCLQTKQEHDTQSSCMNSPVLWQMSFQLTHLENSSFHAFSLVLMLLLLLFWGAVGRKISNNSSMKCHRFCSCPMYMCPERDIWISSSMKLRSMLQDSSLELKLGRKMASDSDPCVLLRETFSVLFSLTEAGKNQSPYFSLTVFRYSSNSARGSNSTIFCSESEMDQAEFSTVGLWSWSTASMIMENISISNVSI